MKALKIFATVVLQVAVVLVGLAVPQESSTSSQSGSQPAAPQNGSQAASNPGTGQAGAENNEALEKVLHRMDETAAAFHTAEADFVWTTYNSAVGSDTGTDKGNIYFRRSGTDTQMAAHLLPPSARDILFANGKLQVYTPGLNEIKIYDVAAHRDEVEAFLVLGFGSSGSDLRKTFAVRYAGQEKIGEIETANLELVPTAASVRNQFPKIDLWIDPQRGVSVRQKLFQGLDGDYRLADYSNIKLNEKLPKDAFKLKTSGKPKTVNH